MDPSRGKSYRGMSLERSLAPLWKLTYYGGLLFDWYRPILHQRCISISFRCIIIAAIFTANAFEAAACLVHFSKIVHNTKGHIQELISEANEVVVQIVILFTWIHFLRQRNSMLIFFADWEKQQPTLMGPITDNQQPITTLRTTIGVYLVYGLFGTGYFCYAIFCAITETEWDRDNVFVSSFPSLMESSFYEVWCRFSSIAQGISFGLFYSLVDIVPIMVYYHGSKMIQVLNIDLERMNIDEKIDITDGLEGIWSRFENLRVLLQRADDLFGSLMIVSHGDSFLVICSTFYSLMNYVTHSNVVIEDAYWELLTCFNFCFYLIRMIIGVVIVSKVSSSSYKLLSTVAFLSLRRCRHSDNNKEERRIMKSIIGRLENNHLAACPNGLYNITPSMLLTMLSLIVSYTIILLQSNNNLQPNNYICLLKENKSEPN